MRILHYLTVSVMVCATALMCGCIDAEPTLMLKKDGSGIMDLEYTISEQSITQFRAMVKLREELAAASGGSAGEIDPIIKAFYDPTEERYKQVFQPLGKSGARIEEITIDTRNAARSVHIRVLFKSLEDLAKTELFTKHNITLATNKQGNRVLRRNAGKRTDDYSSRLSVEEQETLIPILAGFRVVIRVNTPGMILRSNASKTSRYTAQWLFEYDKNPDAVTDIQNRPLEVVFQ